MNSLTGCPYNKTEKSGKILRWKIESEHYPITSTYKTEKKLLETINLEPVV